MNNTELQQIRDTLAASFPFVPTAKNDAYQQGIAMRAALKLLDDAIAGQRPERCGTGQCSCIECPYVCEWKYDDDGFFKSACGKASYVPDLTVGHPDEYMKFCYGCGKPIHFVEPGDDDE